MDKLNLTIGRLERDIIEDGEILIQIALQHPVIAADTHPAANELNRCFAAMAETLATMLSLGMLGEARAAAQIMPEALPYQINGTFTTTYNAHGVLSFYTDVFLYVGGMRGITYRYGSTFAVGDGVRPLFVSALFPAGADVRDLICDFAAERNGMDVFAVREAFSPENVYLTDGGLAVFFHPGDVGPVAGGMVVVVMPYGSNELLSPPLIHPSAAVSVETQGVIVIDVDI
ncbi:MAG: DUF4163 domain-containing protein [Oscillospiraceae bacterium]|nr:DUF4163 domain-containing protein [Oscillospiraceae bacterium]